MKSPFKFLDPFTLEDRDSFFGREKEEKSLYRLVHKTKLAIVYGLSGTGKTSLIQCGLARQFEGPDWLPIFIRRQNNINISIDNAIQKILTDAPTENESLSTRINKIYKTYYRPVFLIFDQFEELFIFGKENEKDDQYERVTFIRQIKDVLDNDCPCTIIISIREEYLGQLYSFEKAIPTFFDYRLRIEPMSGNTIHKVLDASFKKFNITVEESQDANLDKYDSILKNVNSEKSSADLPYLQVYLDRFYREDFLRTYPNNEENTEGVWLPIEFTQEEIKNFGTIEDVLDKFLDEQMKVIQENLSVNGNIISKDLAKNILDAFVSEDGTKRPISIERQGNLITIKEGNKDFPQFDPQLLTQCIQSFENARLLRINDESMELAHDSLAKIIDSKRTDVERLLNDIRKLIRNAQQLFDQVPEYLTFNELNLISHYKDKLLLNADLQAFVDKSRNVREREHQDAEAKLKEDLEREKQLKDEAMRQKDIAEKAKDEAEQLTIVARNEKEKTSKQKRWAQMAAIVAFACFVGAWVMKGKADEALLDQKRTEAKKITMEVDDLIKRSFKMKNDYPVLAKELLKDAGTILKGYEKNEYLEEKREEIGELLK